MAKVFEGRFDGQRAIVTGGASGIGAGIADRLAAEGAEVEVWDLQDAAGLATRKVDVTDWAAVKAAMADYGTPDVLVASAGITGPNLTTWDYPVDDWRAVFELNVHGVFNVLKAAAPPMRAAGYGRIVAIASVAGKEGNPNAPAYSASKAAVIGLTKSLGKELAGSGVTANCVAPAVVETPLLSQMTDDHIAFMKSKIPMGRFGMVDEVAALVTWIASPEASFNTGACFDLTGGRATY
jgi:3-oxoacyl-[acyl-carrier protein] reductase